MVLRIIVALVVGIIAGAVDILPMRNKGIPNFSIYQVFAQWIFIGLVIPFTSWDLPQWLAGALIGTLGMLPIAVAAFFKNRKQIPMIISFAALFGATIGFLNDVVNSYLHS